ncbi:energy-coupling factor transporter transmembrane component T [Enterococcus hirae]|nr:energy-coupling factor transporter transmembrane component T [Enterococcus hirae]
MIEKKDLKMLSLHSKVLPFPLTQVNPLVKGSAAAAFLLLLNLYASPATYLICFLVIGLLCFFIKQPLRYLKYTLITDFFLFVPMFLMQLLFKPGKNILFSWGMIRVSSESVAFSTHLFFKLCLIAAIILLYFYVTDPKELAVSLEEIGLPKTISYVLIATLLLIPQAVRRSKIIMEAQYARGITTSGSLWKRFKMFLPLILPFVLDMLIATEDHALALEARGFSAKVKKTHLDAPQITKSGQYALRFFLAVSVGLILGRVILWKI